ncbi:MAG TPA: M3 family oligoendopeptidase [Alphaproteobacteria bacterium]|nr:M3 family oligoendopeptidase [Alphaproteobacteria bacterium]
MSTGSTAAAQDIDRLPNWDLSDLYPAPDSPELNGDLDKSDVDSKAFAGKYRGKVAALSAAQLAEAIQRYEAIDELLSKASSYAGLVYAGDNEDSAIGRFYQGVTERVTQISAELIFFGLEINRIEDAEMASKLADPALAKWRPWLRTVRLFRAHQLSDELERLLHERHVVGAGAWSRLFDQTLAGMRFEVQGEQLAISDALNLMSDHDRAKRKAAAEAVGAGFERQIRTFALITSTLAKDKQLDDTWRNYSRPVSYRNLSNQVEDEVVDALASAVKGAYPNLAHRYYRLKAKWLNPAEPDPKLDYFDRNAPLPGDPDRVFAWSDARELVLEAYGRFSPRLGEIGRRFFERPWIDAPVRPGKQSGAFAHPTVPSAHPYLLLNYHGRSRDVMTLAHELGHGVHQVLAGAQGHFNSQTPLTLAETASVFGEMLTFQALLARTGDPAERRFLLAAKVEDMLNTVVRQIAFFDFETRVHAARREGELTPDQLGEIWIAVQTESLGPALRFDENYRNFWAYIPHFIHTPFYVYAYAFGDCLVNALYAAYRQADAGFAERYLEMLAAGGTKTHRELLAPFGLDASDPGFWQKGLGIIAGFIDELERLG